jgi:hypothetical protein
MTIRRTLIERGYFPKELPPAFTAEQFAKYACTRNGRRILNKYQPADNCTVGARFLLSRGFAERELRIPHPFSFAKLAELVANNLGRLLKKSSSRIARSRPVFGTDRTRALESAFNYSSRSREKAVSRAGGSYLLKADISQFYPSLYTHAVAWAIDPKSRQRKNWNNNRLLGNKIDRALRDADSKISQGIPIGNDISFLLAEVVLTQVDKSLELRPESSYRWFDDYEISFQTWEDAERTLKKLRTELHRFRLRLNPAKTRIEALPQPTQDGWRDTLFRIATIGFRYPNDLINYFDSAFRYRETYPEARVLSYSIGGLYGIKHPEGEAMGRVAQSCITQALLCEPGIAQKAFSLLSYWKQNGFSLDRPLLTNTITQMIMRDRNRGSSSDVAWALAFCLQEALCLDSKAGEALCHFDDDVILLQALDMHSLGILPDGFEKNAISKTLKGTDLDKEHWLLAYESVRHAFLANCDSKVKANPLFGQLLSNDIGFYRRRLPPYALFLHPEGAPRWVIKRWLTWNGDKMTSDTAVTEAESPPAVKSLSDAFARLKASSSEGTTANTIAKLMRTIDEEKALSEIEDDEDVY